MTLKVRVIFVVDLTYLMTPKGHGVIRGCCDLLIDPKSHGYLCGLFDLVYDPKSLFELCANASSVALVDSRF